MDKRVMKKIGYKFSLFILVAFISGCNGRIHSSPPKISPVVEGAKAQKIDRFLEKLTNFGFAGQVLVEDEGEVILKNAYGLADRSSGRAVTLNTVFTVASLGKQFTSTAILKLESEGKLSTDDTIDTYFDDVPPDKKSITLFYLLTHSSGLPYHMDGNFTETGITDKEIIDKILNLPLLFELGESRSYSNLGYNLLGFIIEKVTGSPVEEYFKEEFFEPLEMSNTGYQGERDWLGAHSYGDTYDYGDISEGTLVPKAIGAGGQLSTVDDLYKWELALRENKILDQKATQKLFTPYLQNEAMGWRVFETPRGTKVILHAGDFQGMNVEYRRYPEDERTIILMSSTRKNADGYRRPLMNMLSFAMEGQSLPELPSKGILSAPKAPDEGIFVSEEEDLSVTLKKENNQYYLIAETQKALSFLSSAQNEQRTEYLNQRSGALIDLLKEENWYDTAPFLNGNLSPANMEHTWSSLISEYTEELGELSSHHVVGTYISDEVISLTYFNLKFSTGEKTGTLVWFRDQLLAFHFHNPEPLYFKLVAGKNDQLYNYSVFNDQLFSIKLKNQNSFKISNSKSGEEILFELSDK